MLFSKNEGPTIKKEIGAFKSVKVRVKKPKMKAKSVVLHPSLVLGAFFKHLSSLQQSKPLSFPTSNMAAPKKLAAFRRACFTVMVCKGGDIKVKVGNQPVIVYS
jgi:hypothetical protein